MYTAKEILAIPQYVSNDELVIASWFVSSVFRVLLIQRFLFVVHTLGYIICSTYFTHFFVRVSSPEHRLPIAGAR